MWQDRFLLQVGQNKLDEIKDKTILLVGLGGVGGYALESLVRSGIEHIIIVDYDVIDVTNLNRQIISDTTNIGKFKVDAFKERILKINPNCVVEVIKEKLGNDIDFLFTKHIDYIVDACDTFDAKMALIKAGINYNIKTISCMGTGNKLDPTKLSIMDISKTSYDPLARKIRKKLKEEHINKKVLVVCSTEKPIETNRSVISSNAFVPATAGLLITSYIINDIINN